MRNRWLVYLALLATVAVTGQVQAASDDECAIWICAPGGFPSGCGAAHAAMVDRVKDMKPPLPSFSSCAVTPPGGDQGIPQSQMDANYGVAAYIPQRQVCTRWETHYKGERCAAYETLPESYVRGTSCRTDREGYTTPKGCTRTERYIEVLIDGTLAGPTYYW